MFKKAVLILSLLICILSVNVSALQVGDDFLVYGKDNEKMSQTLGMSETEIEQYCKTNNIVFLAVNSDNTKQIRKTEITDSFTQKIGNLSVMKNADILALQDSLCSVDGVSGEIIEKQEFKYLKVEAKTKDSGGEYVLTQYVTVKDGKKHTLSFYTANGENRDYTQKVFNSQFKDTGVLKVIVILSICLFAVLAVVIIVLLIKDYKKEKATD